MVGAGGEATQAPDHNGGIAMNIIKLVFRLLLGRRPPITTGTLKVSGVSHPVMIRRDGYGIA